MAFAFGGLSLCGCRPGAQPDAALRVIEERDTQFGRLAVVELGRKRYLAYGPDIHFFHESVLDLDRPHELAAPYTRLMMLGVVYAQPYSRMVQIGVGAGNMTGYAIRTFPSAVVHAIDIDRHAVELGARYFGLAPHPRLHLHIEDGRSWLAASKEQFDVVMLDAYDDQSIPAALMDAEFFAIVAARLAPGGAVMQNVYMPIVDAKRLLAALRASFAEVDFYKVGDSAVLAAYQGPARDSRQLTARARELDATLRPVHSLANLLTNRAKAL
ncbi:MAG: fused MFS/spermidine synthase [Burkholderiales bacterium]|nr:fused MFS/spermidine synthase [Burkholderiales bacterium]